MARTITARTSRTRAATAALALAVPCIAASGCVPVHQPVQHYRTESYSVQTLSDVTGGGADVFFVRMTEERWEKTVLSSETESGETDEYTSGARLVDTDATVLRCTIVRADGHPVTTCESVLSEHQAATAARQGAPAVLTPPPPPPPPKTAADSALCEAYRAKIAALAAAGRSGADLPVLPEECAR